MSHKFASALLAAFFLAVSSFSVARAEPPAPAASSAATLSPDEARRALDTLQDDKKLTINSYEFHSDSMIHNCYFLGFKM